MDFNSIIKFINEFELDNRNLCKVQFLVAEHLGELVGFGRIRNHENCFELCSLGVVEPKRLQGIGKRLVEELILKSDQPLYLVCIIPEYFVPFGFNIVKEYPIDLEEKLNYCTSELVVKETYVVMKHF
jgi:N-acetylglutamate synthase-like GNAT family acetyltransferase